MQQWRVQRLALSAIGSSSQGITSWGLSTDGCRLSTVKPHIEACLRTMNLAVNEIRPGTNSPFFSVVDGPSRMSEEAMRVFGKLMNERDITGPYCDEPGRAMLIEHFRLAKIADIAPLEDAFGVRVVATSSRPLDLLMHGLAACEEVVPGPDWMSLHLLVKAKDITDLTQQLRLIGNMMELRWDRRDVRTLELLGEPLL